MDYGVEQSLFGEEEMIIKKGQRKRIKCDVCKSVKNATLIHAKRSYRKYSNDNGDIGEMDTFELHYRIGKHQRGRGTCKGSDKIQERQYDGTISSGF